MIISISELDRLQKPEFDFCENLRIPDGYYNLADNSFTASVCGMAYKADEIYCVEMRIVSELKAACDRCLKHMPVSVDCERFYRFALPGTVDEADEHEFTMLEGREIDLCELVIFGILAEIPMKILCNEGCKGLCPFCGHDLNLSECGCDHSHFDPRFEALRSLL